jgi:hypothetical protein
MKCCNSLNVNASNDGLEYELWSDILQLSCSVDSISAVLFCFHIFIHSLCKKKKGGGGSVTALKLTEATNVGSEKEIRVWAHG